METQEILRELERFTGSFPRAAVEAAAMRCNEITPELLRILREATERAVELDAEGDYMGHIYSMYLLAQFREVRAYPLVVEFVSLPGKLLDSLCGSFITEGLGKVLASVCGGELGGIQSLIENEAVDEWARGAALSSLVSLVVAGQKSREEIVSYFGQLYRGKLVREFSQVWNALVLQSADLYPAELMDDIKQAYQDDLVERGFIGLDDVKRRLAISKGRALAALADKAHYGLVEDTVQEMEWWACFEDDEPAEAEAEPTLVRSVEPIAPATAPPASPVPPVSSAPPPPPFRRAEPKIGRNEPCPCGSGKKFKKCCGS